MRDADMMRIARVWGVLALCSIPAMLFPGAVADAVRLPVDVTAPATLDLTVQFWQGRVVFPVVGVSALLLLMTPGLMLALVSRRATTLASWALLSLAPTLLLLGLLAVVAPAVGGPALAGRALAFATFGAGAACAAAAKALRRARGIAVLPSMPAAATLTAILVPMVVLAVLAPKFLWEDANGDGAHAFEASRLLLRQPWPFFPASAGDIASFPGMTSMLFTYPNAWFLRLFGEVHAAARIPYALYLVVVGLGVHALIELGGHRPARTVVAAIWASLAAYTLAIAFSASYSRYNADLALPATQDTLLVACYIGFAWAMVQRAWPWAAGFAMLTYLSLPSGLLLLLFWMLGEVLVMRPRPWRTLAATMGLIVGVIVVAGLAAKAIVWSGQPAPGAEYGLRRTLADLMVLQVGDWRRVLYAAVPAGIFPFAAMLMWRRQDDVARRVAIVAAAYFAFFFVQYRVSLHHFVPAMLLPLVVAGRVVAGSTERGLPAAWLTAAWAAVVLSFPGTWKVSRVARPVGASLQQHVGPYEESDPRVFDAVTLLSELFPADWDRAVPDSTYGGSPLVWLGYMQAGDTAAANYIIAPDSMVVSGARAVAQRDGMTLHVGNDSVLARHRAIRPVGNTSAAIYRIDQRSLFRGRPGRGRIDIGALLAKVGLDVAPLLGTEAR